MGEQFWKHGEAIFKLRFLSYQWQFCKFSANTNPTAVSSPITAGFCEQRTFFLITFPTTKLYYSSSLSLFPFPFSQIHNTSTTRSKSILIIHLKIFCSSSANQHKVQLQRSSIHRFHFQVRPKWSPSICLHARSCWVLPWLLFSHVPPFLHCKCFVKNNVSV